MRECYKKYISCLLCAILTNSVGRLINSFLCMLYEIHFSDQRIADQFATRRVARWYLPLFRQYLEWSVLNTGTILRSRSDADKKYWSGIVMKQQLAEELAFLGNKDVDLSVESDRDGTESDSENDFHPSKIRLQRHLHHTPIVMGKRKACRAHKQRKLTRYACSTCKKSLCLGYCWKKYHSKLDYLFDDPGCHGKMYNTKLLD